jgi:hypothetical protein
MENQNRDIQVCSITNIISIIYERREIILMIFFLFRSTVASNFAPPF